MMYPLEEAAPLVIPGWTPCWGFQLVIWQYVHMLLLKLVQLAAGVYIVVVTISSAPLVGVVVTTGRALSLGCLFPSVSAGCLITALVWTPVVPSCPGCPVS